jgi:hypothetical protein
MSIHIDPAKLENFLVEAGVEIPLARAHREMVGMAIEQAVQSFVTEQDQNHMETRIELAISKMNGDLQKQIGEQTWKIIGSVFVMLSLALAAAKYIL